MLTGMEMHMTGVKKLAIGVGLLATSVAVLWQPIKIFVLQDACLDSGGVWASNGEFCIHRECAEDNSCKPNYRNNEICKSLSLGIGRDELFFKLGMPESNKGNVYTFTGGGDGKGITAVIDGATVSQLDCGI